MLVLSRKSGESIMLGSDVEITITSIKNNRVKIGIAAPSSTRIIRGELVAGYDDKCTFFVDECSNDPFDTHSEGQMLAVTPK